MPKSKKNNVRTGRASRDSRKLTKIEPLHPQTNNFEKRYNDLAKFPSENPCPIMRIHKDGTILYANKASTPLLKAKNSDIGKPAPQEWHRLAKEVLASGRIATEEVKDDGRVFSLRAVPIVKNKYVNFYGTDITEQKSLEEALEKERQELQLIIDSSPIIVFYKDKEGRFARVNKAFAEALNMPEEKLVGKTVFDFYSANIAQKMTDDDRQIFKTGRPKLNIVEQYESAKGIRWVKTDKIPIFDKEGIVVGLVGFAQDITESKLAEELLRQSRTLLKSIVDGTSDAIYIKDLQGRYLLFNAGAARAVGKSEQEVLGHDDTALFTADEARTVMEGDRKVMESAKTTTYEEVVTTPDGVRTYLSTKGPIFDSTGRVTGLFGIARDITERKQAEEKWKKQMDELISWHNVTIGRENRVIELKKEVNELLAKLGQPPRYESQDT